MTLPLQLILPGWQLDRALADLGPDATVADLEAFASDMFAEPVTVTVIEDPE